MKHPVGGLMPGQLLDEFIGLVGKTAWWARIEALEAMAVDGRRRGQAALRRHAIELTIARRLRAPERAPSAAENELVDLAGQIVRTCRGLSPRGRAAFQARLHAALHGDNALTAVFHQMRVAARHRRQGFAVAFAGCEGDASFDLMIERNGVRAEIVCDVISADDGRDVPREVWLQLADRIDPDLQTWLAAHPGRYLLKMTLPRGLRADAGAETATLGALQERIRIMLAGQVRADQDAAAMLRLDPLILAGAQADEHGLLAQLRRDFGPEAHLSVTVAGQGVFVMAARAARADDVAAAVRRRLAALSGTRLSGAAPGILAMFLEDTDLVEWRALRDQLRLEGEARRFLASPEARSVVAVSCATRAELIGLAVPQAVAGGELRFANPSHPAMRSAELAPVVRSAA